MSGSICNTTVRKRKRKPNPGDTTVIAISMRQMDLDEIDAEAIRLAMPRSEFLVRAARYWIAKTRSEKS